MGQGAWNGHSSMRPGLCPPGLPSFRELLSTIEIELKPDAQSPKSASVSNNSTKSTSTIQDLEYKAVAAATFNHHENHFQLPVNYPYTQLSGSSYTNSSSHFKPRATEAYGAVLDAPATIPLPNSFQKHVEIEQASTPGPDPVPSSDEGKLLHEAPLPFPLNECIALTKSGRLRKRLQKACDNCREKKVNVWPLISYIILILYLGEMSTALAKVHALSKMWIRMQC